MAANSTSERLNNACFCVTFDRGRLESALAANQDKASVLGDLLALRPNLFSNVPVFLPRETMGQMQAVVDAIWAAANSQTYRNEVLRQAPEISKRDLGPKGVFMGFDFHIAEEGPKLIEINTNAGGAFLIAALADAQRYCCHATRPDLKLSPNQFEDKVLAMFRAEWKSQRTSGDLRSVAIVDQNPEKQFLYPEFLLARNFFERYGIRAAIADPGELRTENDRLFWRNQAVDLVYNRLVDFAFGEIGHAVLRDAYVRRLAVITPNPRAHALLADKRNLILLSDDEALQRICVSEADRMVLSRAIPRTLAVKGGNLEELWRDRRRYFFKPAAGYGSKAVYKGEKLTRNVWEQISAGGYVAQEYVPPTTRRVLLDGEPVERKVDVRLYTYGREVLAVAARLYQGQTTNMRTIAGGFAPVFLLDDGEVPASNDSSRSCCTGSRT